MNAQEIVDELVSGKTVAILSDDAFEFMREVERRGISCQGITMSFRGGQCVMAIENFYCPVITTCCGSTRATMFGITATWCVRATGKAAKK